METESSNPRREKLKFTASLVEISQYAILGLFILYAIGFIVWRSYLASYGISSIGFFQLEYISAAVCFLTIITAYIVAPSILFSRLLAPQYDRLARNKFRVNLAASLSIAGSVSMVFFGTQKDSAPSKSLILLSISPLAIYLIALSILPNTKSTFSKIIASKRTASIILTISVIALYVSFYALNNSRTNLTFLFLCLAVAVVITWYHFENSKGISYLPSVKALLLLSAVLVFVLVTSVFGIMQFGKLPKYVGGGKPDFAFFKFSKEGEHLGISMGLPAVTNTPLLTDCWGPVSILLKTDSEVLFINPEESKLKDYIEYQISQFNPIGDANGNTVRDQNGGEVGFDEIKTVVTINRAKLMAKQIRAELIDAIIYAKADAPARTNSPASQ